MVSDSEIPKVSPVLRLGEATVNLARPPVIGGKLDIMSEVGVEEALVVTPVKHFKLQNLSGNTVLVTADNALTAFDWIMGDVSTSLNHEIEDAPAGGLRVLLVTPETFKTIRQSKPPPEWAGVYVWWDGTVVYDFEYIKSVLAGDGNFDGNNFSKEEFYEEAAHELAESYAGSIYFLNDEDVRKYFWKTNLWFMEGLSETLGRHNTGMSDTEFIASLKEIRVLHSEFSLEALNKGFFLYDQSPTNRNITYQYCERFLKYLSQILTERLEEKDIWIDKEEPYQAAYWLLNRAVKRYKSGKRESITDVMGEEGIMTRDELTILEKEWAEGLLKQ